MKKSFKFMVLLLILSLLLCSMSAFATEPIENNLSLDAVMQRVNNQISTYVNNDLQGNGRGIYATEDVIPLYDLSEEIIAYIVPLFDKNDTEVGYMVTSAFEDGPVMCELSLDNALASDYRNILSKGKKLTYISLMTFGIKANDNASFYILSDNKLIDYKKYSNINNNNLMSSIFTESDAITVDTDYVNNFTTHVKSSTSSNSKSTSAVEAVINLDTVDLNFPNLITPTGTYYGGDQAWFGDYRTNYGCGTVAAANIMAYYDKYHEQTSLYAPSGRTKADFTTHMNNVEEYVVAEFGGIATLNEFVSEQMNTLLRICNGLENMRILIGIG